MLSITIVRDAPNCGITYDRHYDDSNSFLIQATGLLHDKGKCLKSNEKNNNFQLLSKLKNRGVEHFKSHVRQTGVCFIVEGGEHNHSIMI